MGRTCYFVEVKTQQELERLKEKSNDPMSMADLVTGYQAVEEIETKKNFWEPSTIENVPKSTVLAVVNFYERHEFVEDASFAPPGDDVLQYLGLRCWYMGELPTRDTSAFSEGLIGGKRLYTIEDIEAQLTK